MATFVFRGIGKRDIRLKRSSRVAETHEHLIQTSLSPTPNESLEQYVHGVILGQCADFIMKQKYSAV